jgi:hypothetical protein
MKKRKVNQNQGPSRLVIGVIAIGLVIVIAQVWDQPSSDQVDAPVLVGHLRDNHIAGDALLALEGL